MKVSAENPRYNGLVPHLLCSEEDVAEIVLLPGDPARVPLFGSFCDNFRIAASNREYTVGKGTYKGVPVTICSTGIGAPSTEIAIVELMELGAKALIRVGGTGVIRPEIQCGDMVINTAALRLGGSSNFYAPPEYPAAASFEVVHCLTDACKSANVTYWSGYCASTGSFFAGQGRPAAGIQFHDDDLIDRYKKMRLINMEMEAETVFTLGTLLGAYVGSICAVHANRERDEWMQDFTGPQKQMCEIALETAVLLKERYL